VLNFVSKWQPGTIRTRLILLILVLSAVSLIQAYVGLRQAEESSVAFKQIFENRVASTGYLKNVQMAYTVQIVGAMIRYTDGLVTSDEALTSVNTAGTLIAEAWPKFKERQMSDADRQLAEIAEALRAEVDGSVNTLKSLLQKADRAGVRKFLNETWFPAVDPFEDQLNQLYETLQSESRNDFEDLSQNYEQTRQFRLLLVGLGLSFSIFLGWTVLRAVTGSLSDVRHQLHELAAGGGDLTRRLPAGKDEVGLIAKEVNGLMDKLLTLVRRVQESGIEVTSSSTQLAASSKELDSTLSEQVTSTHEVVSSAKQISATAQTLVRTMAEVATLSHDLENSAGLGQTGLVRMSATMEKMEAASAAIAQKLAAINSKVNKITTVVTTINKVADQTNLLSLNASIEAAKAGEFGQGFAVVAREIRRLADQTAVATLDIEQMVKEMQSSVSAGVMGMEKFAQEVQGAVREVSDVSGQIVRIIEQVQRLGPRFESVNEGMESQSIGARQISDAMIQLSEATSATADSQREVARVIQILEQAARVLHSEVSVFRVADTGESKWSADAEGRA
jgi:methyl-accepting chemotaxis protein WspA